MREGTARPQQTGQQAGPAVRRVARPHSRSAKQHLQRGAGLALAKSERNHGNDLLTHLAKSSPRLSGRRSPGAI